MNYTPRGVDAKEGLEKIRIKALWEWDSNKTNKFLVMKLRRLLGQEEISKHSKGQEYLLEEVEQLQDNQHLLYKLASPLTAQTTPSLLLP